jgi:hypothetical protein
VFRARISLLVKQDRVEAWVCDDLLKPVKSRVKVMSFDLKGSRKIWREKEVVVEANSSKLCVELSLSELNIRDRLSDFLACVFKPEDNEPRYDVVFLERVKHISLPKPRIRMMIDKKGEQRMSSNWFSNRVAKACEVRIRGVKVDLSDNFFDLPPSIEKRILIKLGKSLSRLELKKRITISHYSGTLQPSLKLSP